MRSSDKAGKAQVPVEQCLVLVPYRTLRGCVERNPDLLSLSVWPALGQSGQGQVLDNDGIGTGIPDTEHHLVNVLKFVVIYYGVQCDEHSRTEPVGIDA